MLAICTFPLSPCQLSFSVRMGISTLSKGRGCLFIRASAIRSKWEVHGLIDVLRGLQPASSPLPPRPPPPFTHHPLLPLFCPPAPGAWQLPVSTASGRRGASSARSGLGHLQSEARTCTSYKASNSVPLPGCVATAKSLSLSEPQWPCVRNGCLGNLDKSNSLLASAHRCQRCLRPLWAAEAVLQGGACCRRDTGVDPGGER